MSFSGFSEDDIRKLTKKQNVQANKNPEGQPKTATIKALRKSNNNNNVKILKVNATNCEDIPDDAKLSVPEKEVVQIDSNNQLNGNGIIDETSEPQEKPIIITTQNSDLAKNERKCIDLDEFEVRQKLIEEQNRKRKELLSKALADRTKKTQEEAQRLSEIQDEFKKLDAILSADVKILRKQIELASIDYMECQKRYQRVEKEFLDAKLLLHQKQEKKDLLTEHLCAIIEKNEERKAKKLDELLQRLQIAPSDSNFQL